MIRTFIYKRTHEGDPSEDGRFGCFDCMGKLRNLGYDAVIGVGGIGASARRSGIAGIVSWIGVGPIRASVQGLRGDLVTFEEFRNFANELLDFRSYAPTLSNRLYSKYGPRFIFDDFNPREQSEIESLLALFETADHSRHRVIKTRRRSHLRQCPSRYSHQ
jgi:hypothetical protein